MSEDVDQVETPAYVIAQAFAHGDEQLAGAIRHALRTAIAAEREACARIAEADTSFMMLQEFGMQSTATQVRINIADAIRARGTTP